MGLFLLVFCLLALLYVPAVQDFIVPKVLDKINSGGDMNISVSHFRLSFPLDVDLRDVKILQKGDTMLLAKEAKVSVDPLPLITGEIAVSDVELNDIYYKSGAPDSTMYLRARVDKAALRNTDLRLSKTVVDIDQFMLDGGRVDITTRQDTTPPTPPSEASWKIHANRIAVKNIDYRMSMVPTIDSLTARFDDLILADGDIDLSTHNVDIQDISIKSLDAKFLTPALAQTDSLQAPIEPVDTFPSEPWTIKVAKFNLSDSRALYAKSGAKPVEGLDFDYVKVNRLDISLDSIFNRGPVIRVPIKSLHAAERSGLTLDLSGLFSMDSTAIKAQDIKLLTNASVLDLDADIGLGVKNPADAPVVARLGARLAVSDLQTALPSLAPALAQLPKNRKINVAVDVDGTMADVDLRKAEIDMPRHLQIALAGKIKNPTYFDSMDGNLTIKGEIQNVDFVKPTVAKSKAKNARGDSGFNIPPSKINGRFNIKNATLAGDLTVKTGGGKVALDAKWDNRREGYNISCDLDSFPVHSILPGLGVGNATATFDADGRGLDPMSPATVMHARLDAINIAYNRSLIHDLTLDANLIKGNAAINLASKNSAVNMVVDAKGNLAGRRYDWSLDGDIAQLDLHALGLSDSIFNVKATFNGNASLAPKDKIVRADFDLTSFDVAMGSDQFAGRDFDITLDASSDMTAAAIKNQDLSVNFVSPTMLDSLAARFNKAMIQVDSAVVNRHVNVIALQQALPTFKLNIDAGADNALSRYLANHGTAFRSAEINAANDSLINITARIDSLVSGSTRLDSIALDIKQNGKFLVYKAKIDNKPGTMDNFAHVTVEGYVADDKGAAFVRQRNLKGETGYNVGAVVAMTDSTLRLNFVPFKPVIGYKQWTVNKDNFILLNTRHTHFDANVAMESAESSLKFYTIHDSTNISGQEDLYLKIDKIKIAEWLNLSPYAPPVAGDLSADMRLSLAPSALSGNGTVQIADFTYDKTRVGTLDFGIDLTTKANGAIFAKTALDVDGRQVLRAAGNVNDTTAVSPFLIGVELTRFPLDMANPFIGAKTATLSGFLNGNMDLTGSLSKPNLNGYLAFDSATVKVAMLGTTFRFSDQKIPVDSNIVRFENYPLYGVNDNPLTINGLIDMRSLSDIAVDIDLKADNMQVVNSQRRKGADIYGKAFISLDAKARGNMRFMSVDASIDVMPGTNVTYVIQSTTGQLTTASDNGMVKFVNFNDTTRVEAADSIAQQSLAMKINALLTVQQGSTIGVDLSTDGKNRVQVESNGSIDFSMSPLGDTRFTGRLNINKGFVRYTPPFMSEKLFDFQEGSYVGFNGDMLNPALNIHAVDRMRANVTREGQNSRLIYFDVGLNVTGTLQNMDVAFDLSTDDDVSIENELQSMSAEQRANQAMNLLLYNVYTGPGSKGSANLSGNPLYSFLESTLNSWMANNIKGVDISFGMDQYDKTVNGSSSTATSYSYRVSKSFLNDRFKIVIGGNYSTDASDDENFSQNLINDVSFEYMLNRSGSMYIRLFRHTGYESILEGEVTQTGVGFVYRRKLRSLRDLFRFGRGAKVPQLEQQGRALEPTAAESPVDAPAQTADDSENREAIVSDRKPFNPDDDEK